MNSSMNEKIVINLHLTDACDFNCLHCFAHFGAKRVLSVNEWKIIVDNTLEGRDVQRFNLAGGEPLLYRDIFELSTYIRSRGCEVSIITNGYNLSAEKIKQLKECGISMIGLSIDSSNPQTLRQLGRNTASGNILDPERCVNLCRCIRENGISLKINTVVSSLNYTDDLNSFIREASPDRWKLLKIKKLENNVYDNTALLINDAQFDNFVNCHKNVPHIVERSMANTYIMIDALGNLVDTGSDKNTPIANLLNTSFSEAFKQMNFDMKNYQVRYAA